MLSKFTTDCGNDLVVVFQYHTKHSIGQYFFDLAR